MFAEAQRPAREGGRELPDWLSSCARLSSPTHTCILTPLPSLGRTYFVLILSRSFEEGGWEKRTSERWLPGSRCWWPWVRIWIVLVYSRLVAVSDWLSLHRLCCQLELLLRLLSFSLLVSNQGSAPGAALPARSPPPSAALRSGVTVLDVNEV